MDNITDRELLTEGSVWIRENGKKNLVLFQTNRVLKPKIQKNHPPQVIYMNEAGDLFNQSVKNFLETRTFLNVNPILEQRALAIGQNIDEEGFDEGLDTLLVVDEADTDSDAEEEGEDGLTIADRKLIADAAAAENAASGAQDTQEVDSDTQEDAGVISFFPMNGTELPVTIPASELQARLASYEVSPQLERGWLVHTMAFRCGNGDVANDIFKAFHAENGKHNVLFGLDVQSPAIAGGREQVQWTHSLGAWPYIVEGENFIKVMVAVASVIPIEITSSDEDFEPAKQEIAPVQEVPMAEESPEVPSDLLERVESALAAESSQAPKASQPGQAVTNDG